MEWMTYSSMEWIGIFTAKGINGMDDIFINGMDDIFTAKGINGMD